MNMPAARIRWLHIGTEDGKQKLFLAGRWLVADEVAIERELRAVDLAAIEQVNGRDLAALDTSSALLLISSFRRAERSIGQVALVEFKNEHLKILELVQENLAPPTELKRRKRFGLFARIGYDSLGTVKTVAAVLSFVGATTIELVRAVLDPRRIRLKELAVQLETSGFNAIPIVALLTFLIGIVIAYLSGVQIEKYGANIFIVDGVALAMCRELSPILVAIIVAGRSGSAYTAQIGAMKLNEEIDALISLGLSPMRVLVVPRLIALALVMPLLVFIGDAAGIFGGMLAADLRLGVTFPTFLERLHVALPINSVFVGLAKAPIFGLFIATIGCRMGLQVENNARSVGMNTTGTVVRSIVCVILLNAAFAVIFSELKI